MFIRMLALLDALLSTNSGRSNPESFPSTSLFGTVEDCWWKESCGTTRKWSDVGPAKLWKGGTAERVLELNANFLVAFAINNYAQTGCSERRDHPLWPEQPLPVLALVYSQQTGSWDQYSRLKEMGIGSTTVWLTLPKVFKMF